MRKAEFIPFDEKKTKQMIEDDALGPAGRFKKMFQLISMSLLFSSSKQLKIIENDDRFITLNRLKSYGEFE